MKKEITYSKDTIERINKKLTKNNKNLSEKEKLKKLKKELYEIHYNYYKKFSYTKAIKELQKSTSIETHEKLLKKYDPNRFKVISSAYEKIFEITGKPKILTDLACGLNPLTLPWMKLDKNCKYYCYDLEKNLIDFLNNYFKLIKKDYTAYLTDVISTPPKLKSDVAFMFKSTTCFEWQKPGNTIELIKKINTNYLVISVMLRGPKNINGTRNYLKNILGEFIKNKETHEIILEKEYFLIIKINKGLKS